MCQGACQYAFLKAAVKISKKLIYSVRIALLGDWMRKLYIIWLPALLVALSISFFACASTGKIPEWSDVTSLDQLNGTWNTLLTRNETIVGVLEAQGQAIDPFVKSLLGNMGVQLDLDWDITFNAAGQTLSAAGKSTFAFLEGTTNILWMILRQVIVSSFSGGHELKSNNSNHTFELSNTFGPMSIPGIEGLGKMEINRNGTQVRAYALESIPALLEFFKSESNEFLVLTKR